MEPKNIVTCEPYAVNQNSILKVRMMSHVNTDRIEKFLRCILTFIKPTRKLNLFGLQFLRIKIISSTLHIIGIGKYLPIIKKVKLKNYKK